eukprot:gene18876-22551_t
MTFPDSGMHGVHGVPSEVKILLDEGVVQDDPVSTLDYLDSDEEDDDVRKLLAAAADAPEPEADEEWNTDMAPGDPLFVGDTDADHLTVGEAVCYFMELRRSQHWSRPAFDRFVKTCDTILETNSDGAPVRTCTEKRFE